MKPFDKRPVSVVAAAVMLSACVGPMGPSPQLMPPPSPMAMSADATCRQYADAQIAPLRDQANAQTVGSTLVGAGLGAALGAAIGGGRGAAIGAASGGALGVGVGAANAQNAAYDLQGQYNVYYANCMAAQGAPPPPGYAPPPPPGYAPPPPRY